MRTLSTAWLASALALVVAGPLAAWTPSSQWYGPSHGYGGFSVDSGGPSYGQNVTINPYGSSHVVEDVAYVRHVVPKLQRNVEHVYHNLDRVHHVVHEIEQDLLVQNVRVHHNMVRDRTVHHYRQGMTVHTENIEEHTHGHQVLPPEYAGGAGGSWQPSGYWYGTSGGW